MITNRDEETVQEVLEAERAWTAAHKPLDLQALERLMAEEYVKIDADGRLLDKAATLASYRSPGRSWEMAISDEHQVRLFGEVALLTGRWRGKGENDGKPFDYASRFMSIYVKRGGRWLMAAEQATPIAS